MCAVRCSVTGQLHSIGERITSVTWQHMEGPAGNAAHQITPRLYPGNKGVKGPRFQHWWYMRPEWGGMHVAWFVGISHSVMIREIHVEFNPGLLICSTGIHYQPETHRVYYSVRVLFFQQLNFKSNIPFLFLTKHIHNNLLVSILWLLMTKWLFNSY